MNLIEEYKDLFTVDECFHLAHCIASDLKMGAGIAVPMQRRFGLRDKIRNSGKSTENPTCILVGRVFNLITKSRSSGKPSYQSLEASLYKMRELVMENNIKKIAMPKIGCGLDRLQWGRVREMIKDIFGDLNLEVLVCVWG